MNFLALKQNLSGRLSALDETVANDATELGRFINLAYNEICGMWDWPFLRKLDIIQTKTEYTTGTASVNSGSSSVTLSVAPSVSLANRFIQFSGNDDWYEITSHTAATTALTIDPAYGPSANFVAGTFTVRVLYYPIDTTVDQINSVSISRISHDLVSLTPLSSEPTAQMLDSIGQPTYFTTGTPSTTGSVQMCFYPTPDDVYNVYVMGKKQITELSSDSDSTIFPPSYQSVLLDLAAFYGFEKLNDSRATNAYQKFERGLEKMKSIYSQNKGRTRVMRSIDNLNDAPNGLLPSTFGPMSYD